MVTWSPSRGTNSLFSWLIESYRRISARSPLRRRRRSRGSSGRGAALAQSAHQVEQLGPLVAAAQSHPQAADRSDLPLIPCSFAASTSLAQAFPALRLTGTYSAGSPPKASRASSKHRAGPRGEQRLGTRAGSRDRPLPRTPPRTGAHRPAPPDWPARPRSPPRAAPEPALCRRRPDTARSARTAPPDRSSRI